MNHIGLLEQKISSGSQDTRDFGEERLEVGRDPVYQDSDVDGD